MSEIRQSEQAVEAKISSRKPDANAQMMAEAAHEFVFAVVGHIGSGTSDVARSFKELLERRKTPFQTTILKARDVIEEWAASVSAAYPKAPRSIDTAGAWQDLGDEMRKKTEDHAAVAKGLIRGIRKARARASKAEVADGEPVHPDVATCV